MGHCFFVSPGEIWAKAYASWQKLLVPGQKFIWNQSSMLQNEIVNTFNILTKTANAICIKWTEAVYMVSLTWHLQCFLHLTLPFLQIQWQICLWACFFDLYLNFKKRLFVLYNYILKNILSTYFHFLGSIKNHKHRYLSYLSDIISTLKIIKHRYLKQKGTWRYMTHLAIHGHQLVLVHQEASLWASGF